MSIENNKTKILVNVYEPLIDIMKSKLDAACLKRDAYLDIALRSEVNFLLENTTSNSDKAKNYITDNLKQLKLKPLNLLLSTETIDLINSICKDKNVPRDAFINRVFLLMVAYDTILTELFYGIADGNDYYEYWEGGYGREKFEELVGRYWWLPNTLDIVEGLVRIPPLWKLRSIFENNKICERISFNFYNYYFERYALNQLPPEYGPLRVENSIGFNVFMTDDDVSKDELQHNKINTKTETDKLVALIQQEKLVKRNKSQQKYTQKEKPVTETKAENADLAGESQ